MKLYKELPTVDVTLPADVDTVLRLEGLQGLETYSLQVYNTGANGLTAFSVYGQAGKPDIAHSLLQSTDYVVNNPGDVVFYASSDPVGLGAGQTCLLKIEVSDLSSIKIMAKSTAGTSIRTVAGGYSYVANA